jgi:hypothetical protein
MNIQSLPKALIIVFTSLCFYQNIFAQDKLYQDTSTHKAPKIVVGIGAGMLNYYGDIGYNKVNQPMQFKGGYNLDVQYNFSKNLGLNFFLLGGKFFGEENSIARNLNFESQIFNEGLILRYNFGPKDPYKYQRITPFIGVGIGFLSYVTKSDLYDANGVQYNYWTDGSIRSLPQSSPNAENATLLNRDYVYETEVGSGNTITIPINLGFKFQVTPNIFLRLETTFNFTMTNQIDYVQVGQFVGNHANDNFLYSAITLNYDFGALTKPPKYKVDYNGVDYDGLIKEGTAEEEKIKSEPAAIPENQDVQPSSSVNEATANNIPNDLRKFDLNEDGYIDASEISAAIDAFFENKDGITVDQIYKLIDYFFDQK